MTDQMAIRLERSTLIVPASRPAMIAKAAMARADAVCIDCEDAVAPDMKTDARVNVVEALNTLNFGDKLRQVRINALDTEYAYRDLIDIIEGAGQNLDLVVLPKANRAADIHFVDTLLTQIETACKLPRPIGIGALIETAEGLAHIQDIAASSPRLESLIFGSGDFAASMQMPLETIGGADSNDRLYPGHRWHFAWQAIVVAARANGLRAIDGPYADIRDSEGLDQFARMGRALGFDGKWCIHPSQPSLVDAVYSPTDAEYRHAQRVIEAYNAALEEGTGAITVDGKMVDAANLKMCRHILAKAEKARAQA